MAAFSFSETSEFKSIVDGIRDELYEQQQIRNASKDEESLVSRDPSPIANIESSGVGSVKELVSIIKPSAQKISEASEDKESSVSKSPSSTTNIESSGVGSTKELVSLIESLPQKIKEASEDKESSVSQSPSLITYIESSGLGSAAEVSLVESLPNPKEPVSLDQQSSSVSQSPSLITYIESSGLGSSVEVSLVKSSSNPEESTSPDEQSSSVSLYPASIKNSDSSDIGTTKELVSSAEPSSRPKKKVSFDEQSTSQDVSDSIFGRRQSDYRNDSMESQPSISSEESSSSTKVKKDDEDAKRFLDDAREESDYRIKLKNLNKSLAAAKSSEMLVEAYTERAILLRIIREQDLAVLDTHRALALLSPLAESEGKSKKIETLATIRRNACFDLRRRSDYRRIAIEYPFELLMPREDIPEILDFSREIEEPKPNQVDEIVNENSLAKDWEVCQKWIDPYGDPTPTLSPMVKLVYNGESGWHWRAEDEILPGEPLSTQDYFAVKMSPETLHFYCSYCTMWCLALIPCKKCRMEMYCSELCREKAFKSYHETECIILRSGYLSTLKEKELALLALRIFLIGTKKGAGLRQSPPLGMKSEEELYQSMFTRETRSEGWMSSDKYGAVLSLFWREEGVNSFTQILNPKLQHDVIEVFVALRSIKYFSTLSINVFSHVFREEEGLALVLLVQNFALLSYYHSDIYAHFFGNITALGTKKIGQGLHILHSLLNNSCNPEAAIMRDRRRELVFAVRRIAAKEEIHISYVGDYGKRSYGERGRDLKNKHRINKCHCEACQDRESWKVWDGESSEQIECPKKEKSDGQAQTEDEAQAKEQTLAWRLFLWRERFREYLNSPLGFKEEDLARAFSFQENYKDHKFENPSQTIWLCEKVIKVLMPIFRGNFRMVKKVMKDPSSHSALQSSPAPDSTSSRKKVTPRETPRNSPRRRSRRSSARRG